MKISQKAREFLIERNEGLRLEAYPDPGTGGDPWTIGYGDTGPDVYPGLIITKEEAVRRLDNRLENDFGKNVNRKIEGVGATQGQFDAMVSLSYNIGNGGFNKSSVLREHLKGNYLAAADAFLLWNKGGGRVLAGLVRRRGEERDWYLKDGKVEEGVGEEEVEGILRRGDKGEEVEELQKLLMNWVVDGDFGSSTEYLVKEFQRQNGLVSDGVVGRLTWGALRNN